MLFELRNSVPSVSDPWVEARDFFLKGDVRAAWNIVRGQTGKAELSTANDSILNIEIARACGIVKPYLALVRIARKRFPQDPIIQLYYSRMLQSRGRHILGTDYLLEVESSVGKTHRGWWGAQLANIYADAGFGDSCENWLKQVKDEPLFDSPLALYSRACAHDSLTKWETAIELSQRCVELAPDWSRARVHLVSCLLARGRVECAQEQFEIVREKGHQESYIDFSSAMMQCALGNFQQSAIELQSCLTNWPDAEFHPWVRRMLYVLHIENGRYDEARKVTESYEASSPKEFEKQFGLPTVEEVEKGQPHQFIPIPMVAQYKSQCVPTTVAMATHPQGRRLDPDLLYKEMWM